MQTNKLKVGHTYTYVDVDNKKIDGTYLAGDDCPIWIFKIHEKNAFLILSRTEVESRISEPKYINSIVDLYER